tara:strand:- start:1633 stop:2835 length:1203 start_codon:yes stop_codon:yes gene_type:complete
MSNTINSWDEFQPLEELVVGTLYDSSFFNDVKNDRIKSALKKIIDQTHEDLDNFKTTMQSHNIKVYQPDISKLDYKKSILDYVNVNGELGYKKNVGEDGLHDSSFLTTAISHSLIPNPPLQPRDDGVVMGNKLLMTDPSTFATKNLIPVYQEWFGKDNVDISIEGHQGFTRSDLNLRNWCRKNHLEPNEENMAKARANEKLYGFCSPTLTRIGKTCLVDTWQVPSVVEEFLADKCPEYNFKKITIGGHNDSIFSVLKPGLVIASHDLKGYEHVFADWKIIWFDDPNWDNVKKWSRLRYKNQGKWWVPGEEDNDEFTHFVEGILGNWTGYVEETIFDVNCLVIDDRHVVVNTSNPYLLDNLKKNGMEPIVCPLRHSFFWDGGWHCLTLDVKRKGGQIDHGI